MNALLAAERRVDCELPDPSSENLRCDVESRFHDGGRFGAYRVEGGAVDADISVFARNEIPVNLKKPRYRLLAMAGFLDARDDRVSCGLSRYFEPATISIPERLMFNMSFRFDRNTGNQ